MGGHRLSIRNNRVLLTHLRVYGSIAKMTMSSRKKAVFKGTTKIFFSYSPLKFYFCFLSFLQFAINSSTLL